MSLILCIETGTNICSVALSDNDKLISLRESDEGKNHAQNLALFIEEVLTENDISVREVAAVAVGKGPGSYTGLRIGVSVAKGLCYPHNVPLMSVNSLQSLAMIALEDYDLGILDIEDIKKVTLCPMIDARRMEVYTQLFDGDANSLSDISAKIIDKDSFAEVDRGGEFVIFGNGAQKCMDVMERDGLKFCEVVPSARGMVKLAYKSFLKKEFENLAYFEPFYLKDFVAGVSKKNLLIK